ncbi:VOC family protein [Salirhabdus sp. Marseille-P4669]|uniref:VOC family protein n=1 Tax=Salirhabdus sp. Marseille-P4669 TaxID=2042310 RepID=UPI000C7D9C8D|nr:glyoxalase/bleomycin resistance/dioxygenase family protein [Salirhabdus sp. Marseille-P4669]
MKFHHFGLEVADLSAAKSFYIQHLHFHEEMSMEVLGERLVFLHNGKMRLELVEGQDSKKTHICFEVVDFEYLMKIGMEQIEGPYSLPNGWKTVFYKSPSGETLEFLQTECCEKYMI